MRALLPISPLSAQPPAIPPVTFLPAPQAASQLSYFLNYAAGLTHLFPAQNIGLAVPSIWRLAPAQNENGGTNSPLPSTPGGTGGQNRGDGKTGKKDDAARSPEAEADFLLQTAEQKEMEEWHLYAGEAYRKAAELLKEIDPLRSADIFEKAAGSYARLFPDTGQIDSRSCLMEAAEILKGTDPARAFAMLERAAEIAVSAGHHWPAAEIYSRMLDINRQKNDEDIAANAAACALLGCTWHKHEEQIKKLHPEIFAAVIEMISADRNFAAENKISAPDSAKPINAVLAQIFNKILIRTVDHARKSELTEKVILHSVIGGTWKNYAPHIKNFRPSLFSVLEEMDARELYLSGHLPGGLDLEKIERVILEFRRLNRVEMKLAHGRDLKDIIFICKGVRAWRDGGFASPKEVPAWFSFPALAAASGNSEIMAAIARICETKDFRRSRDKRKELMWFLADHSHRSSDMEAFCALAKISSSKKMFANLKRLSIVLLLMPGFTMNGIGSQEEFNEISEKILSGFIGGRTSSSAVSARFMERIDELFNSGFLTAIVTMYSKYERFPETKPLLDMALAAHTMKDFEKVKFPEEKDIANLHYLSPGQIEYLKKNVNQIRFLGDMQALWRKNISLEMVPEGAVQNVQQKMDDVRNRIEEMKMHLVHLLSAGKSGGERFSFDPGFEEEIKSTIGGFEKTGAQESHQYRRLKILERIILSIRGLENVNLNTGRGEIKARLGDLRHAVAHLQNGSTGFSLNNGELEQIGHDIDLLENIMLGENESLRIEKMKAYDSGNAVHLILAGIEPENCGSCQRYDGVPSLMAGLLGYLVNSGVKIIRVENQDGIVLGRAMLKVVLADGKPALLLEHPYYRNARRSTAVDEIIIALANEKARMMQIPLLSSWIKGEEKSVRVVVLPGISAYEYSDALGGIQQIQVPEGGRDIRLTLFVNRP
jgi:hypothetical protein